MHPHLMYALTKTKETHGENGHSHPYGSLTVYVLAEIHQTERYKNQRNPIRYE